MRALVASLAIVAFASALWFASSGDASANHAWGPYHWSRPTNPLALRVIDSTTSGWDAYRATAQTQWSASDVLDLIRFAPDDRNIVRQRCPASTGNVRVCNWGYGQTGWLGIATIWLDADNHIVAGTVKNNDTYFNMAAYNTPAWRQTVMCQEIGHTFGLAHQDEDFYNADLLLDGVASCMDYSVDPSNNRQPNAHDYDQLALIYGHLEGAAAATSAPGSAPAPQGTVSGRPARGAEAPNVDGDSDDALPSGAHAGLGNHFEKRTANGVRVVSEVIWIDNGAAPGGRASRPAGGHED